MLLAWQSFVHKRRMLLRGRFVLACVDLRQLFSRTQLEAQALKRNNFPQVLIVKGLEHANKTTQTLLSEVSHFLKLYLS